MGRVAFILGGLAAACALALLNLGAGPPAAHRADASAPLLAAPGVANASEGSSAEVAWRGSGEAAAGNGVGRERRAWITFASTDSYVPGVLALLGSLARHGAVGAGVADFVLVTTCDVDVEAVRLVESAGAAVEVRCDSLLGDGGGGGALDERDNKVLLRLLKLHVFRSVCDYERVVYVDADVHFLRDPRALLERGGSGARHGFHAAEGQVAGRFNTGVFVLDCDEGLWGRMQSEVGSMLRCESEGTCERYTDRMSKSLDDQGFLNYFFGGKGGKWVKLPKEYNQKVKFYMMGAEWSSGDKPKPLKRDEVVGLHWIGPGKPWRPEMQFPCGSSLRSFCVCKDESAMLRAFNGVFEQWMEDYERGSSGSRDAILAKLPEEELELLKSTDKASKSNCARPPKVRTSGRRGV